MARSPIVHVSSSSTAKSSPTFLIKGEGGRLYLTVAVVEYYQGEVRSAEQEEGVAFMQSMFDRASGGTNFDCYEIDTGDWQVLSFQAPGVGTDPPGGGGVGTQSPSGTSGNSNNES